MGTVFQTFKTSLFLICLVFCCSFSFKQLDQLGHSPDLQIKNQNEYLYLPSGKGLNALSFGYQNTLAHYLWFKTINYFGKHYRGDRDYQWLAHYCDLVTNLNKSMKIYYQFCGSMLAWEANKPEQSLAILTKAINNFPQDWLFYYLRGFTYIFFIHDDQKAREDFVQSAKLPGAHHFVARLASKQILADGSKEEAIQFLQEAIEVASDDTTKSILINRLNKLVNEDPSTMSAPTWNRYGK